LRKNLTITLLLAAALAALVVVSGCGGGDESDADPQEVLDSTLGGTGGVDSGVLELSLDVASTGGQEGNLTASLEGPFHSNGTATLPSVDFDVTASIDSGEPSFDFDGGLTITTDGAFVGFDGTDYQLDDATFQALEASYEQSAEQQDTVEGQGSLEQFGIDPQSWVTDLTNEGTEDLDGTEVVHISGSADVPKLVADLNDIAQQTGQAQQLDPNALSDLEDTVSNATIDVYAATDDDALRQFDIGLTLADPRGGTGEVTVTLSVGISDPGSEQEITAPSDAVPLDELLSQIPGGAEALGLGSTGSTGASGSPTAPAGDAAEKYYDCVAKAEDAAAVDACAAQLGG
jgi:hypothetical protein